MTVSDLSGREPRQARRRARRTAESPPSASPTTLITKSAVLRRLELDVRRRLDGRLTGDYLSAVMGPGSERAGARRYEPGDDARQIDWNLTARAMDAHVRTTEADRELETWVLADRSPSMDFGTAEREKREVVLAVVAAFGVITVRGGNRIGVVLAGGERLQRVPAANSRVAMLAGLSTLYDSPRGDASPDEEGDLSAGLRYLHRTQRRRGQAVVVSDFLDDTDWATDLRRLALRHQVIAVQVSDPREHELPPVGLLSVVDTETGRQLHVQTNSTAVRQRYAAAAAERQQRIERAIRTSGAELLHVSTGGDWLLEIARFLNQRRDRRYASTTRKDTS